MNDAPLAKERLPNWRRPDERAGRWHQRGEAFGELWDAEWEYEPPQWAKDRAQTAATETGRVVRRTVRKRLQKVSDAILSLDTLELLIACLLLGGVNVYAALAGQFSFLPMGEYAPTRQNIGFTDGIYFEKLTKGDTIAGYEITSGFGYRNAPIEGASTFHKGVDVGTPWGTTIHMVGNGSVALLNRDMICPHPQPSPQWRREQEFTSSLHWGEGEGERNFNHSHLDSATPAF